MIPATGPFQSNQLQATWKLTEPMTSAQLASAAGLSASFTSAQLRGKSGNHAMPLLIWTKDATKTVETKQLVTGYSGNRSLRIERYGYTGDAFSTLQVKVYQSNNNSKDGNYTLKGTINVLQDGLAYVDFTLATNRWIKYEVVATATGGKKTGAFEMVIWDLTAGTRLATGNWVNVTLLDSDAPDNPNAGTGGGTGGGTGSVSAVNWEGLDMHYETYDGSGWATNVTSTSDLAVQGFTGTATLQVQATFNSGGLAQVFVWVRKNGGATQSLLYISGGGTTPTYQNQNISVTSGDKLQFFASVDGAEAGYRLNRHTVERYGILTVVNTSDGNKVIDTISLSMVHTDYNTNDGAILL